MGKRSNSGITGSGGGGTPGGKMPDKLPDIKGTSGRQVSYAEDMRERYKNAAENFDALYENVRPIMMKENVGFSDAVDKYIGIEADGARTIEQGKQQSKYAEQMSIATSMARTGFTSSNQSPELQAKINQAKTTYKDQLVGRNKNRLPASIMNRIVLDYTMEIMKRTLREETSASRWIELGKL